METISFWIPILFLFLSALIGTILKRCSSDNCLKKFDGSKVFINSNGGFHEGILHVYAHGLELEFSKLDKKNLNNAKSLIIHQNEVKQIPFLFRVAPAFDTKQGVRWQRELNSIQHPSPWQKFCRLSLNFYNILRDVFGQAANTILGAVTKDNNFTKAKEADKSIKSIGNDLTSLIPNAWEPVLEKHRGKEIIVERKDKNEILNERGILEDYSAQFLLLRNVKFENCKFCEIEKFDKSNSENQIDILYARNLTIVRNIVG
tara:strand:- start:1458 stop:2237 length:780 start_codon:yes stop_codon:yes gene_type:complete